VGWDSGLEGLRGSGPGGGQQRHRVLNADLTST
jgi:hypothetical protein